MVCQAHPIVNVPYIPTIYVAIEKTPNWHAMDMHAINLYTPSNMRGQCNLELALEMEEKERLTNGYFGMYNDRTIPTYSQLTL